MKTVAGYLIIFAPLCALAWQGKVVHIADGDTIKVRRNKNDCDNRKLTTLSNAFILAEKIGPRWRKEEF